MTRVVICGGGLSGGLAALALAKRRPEIELLVLERDERFGGNHIWSFFDTDVPDGASWLLDGIARHRWPDHEVRFPQRERLLRFGYNSIRSADLDAGIRETLRGDQFRCGAEISAVAPDHVMLGTERIQADCVIDARGPGPMPEIELGWQKFIGRVYRFERGHAVARPMIMDATVEQVDGFRFIYLLPLSPAELLVEDTYYSSSPLLDEAAIAGRIDAYVERLGGGAEVMSQERGVLPVVVAGKLASLWPAADHVARLGLGGGFFHPTTGYSLPDALANAALVADQPSIMSGSLTKVLRSRAERLWTERRFFQLLNRMLFRAAEPDERYRIIEHFYRLPPATVARFYAARLTALDKLRILSGRPPVPIARALSALGASA